VSAPAGRVIALAVLLTVRAAATAAAQQPAARPSYERDVPAALLADVKVGEDSARVLALAKVPGAVEAVELLREAGKLLWVWDIKIAGKRGITEVSVNALNGKVETHEE
jgi:uncharacterized membrane protein YkoI